MLSGGGRIPAGLELVSKEMMLSSTREQIGRGSRILMDSYKESFA